MLLSNASLFPKIFNSLISKKELNEVMLLKKPLNEPIGKVKSLKLLQYDIATFDTRVLYEFIGTEDYIELPKVVTYPSEL